MNFAVTIFEGQSEPGGILLFGIPEFRLNKDVVRREIKELLHLGVEIKTNTLIGPDYTVDDLFSMGYDAIFMGTGTSLPRTLNIPGKELTGILTATYFLRMVVLSDSGKLDESETLLHVGDNVIVIGAGNVAMDAARTAIRRGAKNVTVVYHKTEAEISCFPSEYEAAVKEGVQFNFLQQPIAYLNKKQMRALNAMRQKASESDETELAGLLVQNIVKTEDGQFIEEGGQVALPCDCVILAIGQRPAARIVSTTKGIQVDDRGFVITRERPYGMTTRAGVFSSGDVVHGPATVVLAMKESKKVAAGIAQYIDAKKLLAECEEVPENLK
ncbi:pyridine nucleotide-disulfide oxidoreductase [Phascolarctobacterium sp. CAG:266]|nr:pyridine nucleotide-disulfide oxidoreductase [Phascolarctobacterium sp. CAG:266]